MDPSDRNARGGLARGMIRFMNSGGLEKRLSSPLTQYRLCLSTEHVCIAEHGPPIFPSTYPHCTNTFTDEIFLTNFQEPINIKLNEMIIDHYTININAIKLNEMIIEHYTISIKISNFNKEL